MTPILPPPLGLPASARPEPSAAEVATQAYHSASRARRDLALAEASLTKQLNIRTDYTRRQFDFLFELYKSSESGLEDVWKEVHSAMSPFMSLQIVDILRPDVESIEMSPGERANRLQSLLIARINLQVGANLIAIESEIATLASELNSAHARAHDAGAVLELARETARFASQSAEPLARVSPFSDLGPWAST
jgi:hypothetical protein